MFTFFLGTQGEIIKMLPLIKKMYLKNIDFDFVCSGQHFSYVKRFVQTFNLPEPEYVTHKNVTTLWEALTWFVNVDNLLRKRNPKGLVIVQGDALSTLLGARWGFRKSGVVHVESGLYSFDFFNPFPEELIRRGIDKKADFLFASSKQAFNNSMKVAKKNAKVVFTEANTLFESMKLANEVEMELDLPNEKYSVATIHRYETITSTNRLLLAINIVDSSPIKTIIFLVCSGFLCSI